MRPLVRVLASSALSLALPMSAAAATDPAPAGYTYTGEFATFSGVQDPSAMTVSPSGLVYVAGQNPGSTPGSSVRVFTTDGARVGGWDLDIESIGGMTTDAAGNVYVGDYDGRPAADVPGGVRVYSPTGQLLRQLTRPNSDTPTVGDVALDASGNVYTVDPVSDQVSKYSPSGAYVGSFGSPGSGPQQFSTPFGIAISPDDRMYVADLDNDRIQVFTASTGQYLTSWGQSGLGNGQFLSPSEVTVAPDGHVLVVDAMSNRVQEFTPDGAFVRVAAQDRLSQNFDLDVVPDGRLLVAGYLASRQRGVAVFSPGSAPGRLALRSTLLKARGAKVAVKVTCAGTTPCAGKIRLTRGAQVLATARYAVRPGAAVTVKLRLTAAGRRALARPGKQRATLRITSTTVGTSKVKVKVKGLPQPRGGR